MSLRSRRMLPLLGCALWLAAAGPLRAQAPGARPVVGDFTYYLYHDPGDSTRNLSFVASHASSDTGGRHVTLVWRCEANGVIHLHHIFGVALQGSPDSTVQEAYGFDGQAPGHAERWYLSGNHKSAESNVRMREDFDRGALKAQAVTIRVTDPATGTSYDDRFGLRDLDKAIAWLRSCH